MKKVWMAFGIVLFVLILYKAFWGASDSMAPVITRTNQDGKDKIFHQSSAVSVTDDDVDVAESDERAALDVLKGNYATKADSLVAFALQRFGATYTYGGASEDGFDCSGFTTFVYGNFNVAIPHGSTLQSTMGTPVALDKAKKGDLLIFTGTNVNDRTPGHVGIVITNPPKSVQFVHSSSNGGVKVSSVEGTNYAKRLLDVRRVIK